MLRVSVQMDSCPGDLRHCDLVILRLCGSPLRLHSPVRSGEGHPPDILPCLLRRVCRKYTEKQMKNIESFKKNLSKGFLFNLFLEQSEHLTLIIDQSNEPSL